MPVSAVQVQAGRPDEVVTVRLDGPDKLAGVQAGGWYQRYHLGLLFRGECQACGCFSSVGHRSHPAFGRCFTAVVEAFHATYRVPAERTRAAKTGLAKVE